jgi:hypothetical protein
MRCDEKGTYDIKPITEYGPPRKNVFGEYEMKFRCRCQDNI